jgi:DNA-binding transcriptional regulator YhcF (GntR family)
MNILETYKKISQIVENVRINPSKDRKEFAKSQINELIEKAKENDLNLNVSPNIIDKIDNFNDYEDQHSYESSFDEDSDM